MYRIGCHVNTPLSLLITTPNVNKRLMAAGGLCLGAYPNVVLQFILIELSRFTGEGHTPLAVSAFYCWLDLIKYLVEKKGLNPSGE